MPQTFYGPFDERNNNYANSGNANIGRFPLGHTLILPDGREYKFTLNDGTVEVAGTLYQSVAALAGHTDQLVQTPAVVGDRQLEVNIDTTIAGTDIYAEGMVHLNDTQAAGGEGYAYRISRAFTADAAHASAASTANITVNLAPGETIQIALTTAAQATLTRNRYHAATIHTGPPDAQVTGVSPGVAAADRFYWSQVRGFTAVAQQGTMLVGNRVMPSASVNGEVESFKRRVHVESTGSVLTAAFSIVGVLLDQDGVTTALGVALSVSTTAVIDITSGIANNAPDIGVCIKANADNELALVDLSIV